MNRIITILVTIFILLLLYIWISHVWGSDKPRHPQQIVDARQNELSDGMMDDVDTNAYIAPVENTTQDPVSADEFATERKTETTENVTAKPEQRINAVEKPAAETKPVEKKAEPAPKKETTTTTKTTTPKKTEVAPAKPVSAPTTSASTAGQHLVIAGNFTQQVNAQQRVQELKKAGFSNAEVVNFDLSEYHTVCVGRFSDVNEARKLVKKLKDYHKIDAYVRIGG